MEHVVTMRYRWTADEFLLASRYHNRHVCRPIFRLGANCIFALMLFAGIAALVNEQRLIGWERFMPIGFIIGGVYWFFLLRLERRWWARRQFAKRPDNGSEIEWRIGEEQIITKSDLATGEFQWRAFTKVVRSPAGLLFYPNDNLFFWLPRTGFASDSDFERVAEIAKSKVSRNFVVT